MEQTELAPIALGVVFVGLDDDVAHCNATLGPGLDMIIGSVELVALLLDVNPSPV